MRRINFGCGLSVGDSWINYDASPTLRVQKLPFIGGLARRFTKPVFPRNVLYGDIIHGLPEKDCSVDVVFCSHVLEHLALSDFKKALIDIKRILKPGGIFRGVLPDLQQEVKIYLSDDQPTACSNFMQATRLGQLNRPKGHMAIAKMLWGNKPHLWMWDYKGLANELDLAGFVDIRRAAFQDSTDAAFGEIEDQRRWDGCLGFECRKSATEKNIESQIHAEQSQIRQP